MSASHQARVRQARAGYAVDLWMDMTLQPMTKVWQGVGGKRSDFFFSEEDARVARGAYQGSDPYRVAEKLWRLAQVEPSDEHGYREEIAEFVVDLPVAAAVGICSANALHGSGSIYQYFIPSWDERLYTTGRTFKFAAKAY